MARRPAGGNGGQEEAWGCRVQARPQVSPPCLSALFLEDKVGVLRGAGKSCRDFRVYKARLSVHRVIGRLGQQRFSVGQTIKNSSWDPRERGHCRDGFLESQISPPYLLLLPLKYYCSPRPCSHATCRLLQGPSKVLLVRLPCFLPHLFSATPLSITALTCLHFPPEAPDVPSPILPLGRRPRAWWDRSRNSHTADSLASPALRVWAKNVAGWSPSRLEL